jgi:acyl-coenzyme A thioesterase PaaI-like protein
VSAIDEQLKELLERIPYAQFLGVKAELAGDEMTAILPFGEHLVGNPTLPAIHGGVLGAFMEMTALAQLSIKEGQARQPRVIDVSIEYLRSGRPLTTYARAEIK